MHSMPSITDLLFQVFERKGYHLTANATVPGTMGAVYHVPLLAQAGHATLLVDWNTTEVLTQAELESFTTAMRDTGANRGIFIALNGWDQGVLESSTLNDVEVWDHARVALEIGEAVLEPLQGPLPESFHVGRVTSGAAPGGSGGGIDLNAPASLIAAAASAPPAAYAGSGNASGQASAAVATQAPAAVSVLARRAADAAAQRPAPPAPPVYVRPTTSRHEAVAHTRGKLGGDDVTTLEYTPHYAFEYNCGYRATAEVSKAPAPSQGFVLVNAVTGACRDGRTPTGNTSPPTEGNVLAPTLGEAEARAAATRHSIKAGTKDVNALKNVGGTVISQKKRMVPLEEDILLTPRGTFLMPVYKCDGNNGYIRVCAVTNEVLESNYEPIPRGRDAELV